MGFWVGSFFAVEEAIDRARGRVDFLSTVVAGLSVAGGFSAWSENRSFSLALKHWLTTSDRFPLITAARTAKIGLLSGLAFGLTQDALGLTKGRRPFYIDLILGTKHSVGNDVI